MMTLLKSNDDLTESDGKVRENTGKSIADCTRIPEKQSWQYDEKIGEDILR